MADNTMILSYDEWVCDALNALTDPRPLSLVTLVYLANELERMNALDDMPTSDIPS